MSHQIEVYSNLAASMQKIYEAHWESGNEAHSKMGFLVKNSMEKALRKHKTNYTIETNSSGKRMIVKQNTSHAMGDRFDRKTGKKLNIHMGNFIQWRTYSTTGTTVVGGLMKAGYTETRDEGKITGRTKVFGVRQESIDILEKISSGKTGKAKWVNPMGTESMKKFKGTHKPTNFIAEGKNSALSGASAKITKYYSDAIRRRDDLKKQPMKRTV